jgi:hypothetical protein
MNVFLALFVVVAFAAILEYLNLPSHARAVGRRSQHSLSVLRDASLEDREKEEALRRESGRLFRLLGLLVGGSVVALGLPLAAVWLLEQVGVGSFWGTLGFLERLDFLAGVTFVGGLGYLLARYLYSQ